MAPDPSSSIPGNVQRAAGAGDTATAYRALPADSEGPDRAAFSPFGDPALLVPQPAQVAPPPPSLADWVPTLAVAVFGAACIRKLLRMLAE